MNYTTEKPNSWGNWVGEALVPLDYFPPGVNKFNAMARYSTDINLIEQLYPQQPILNAKPAL